MGHVHSVPIMLVIIKVPEGLALPSARQAQIFGLWAAFGHTNLCLRPTFAFGPHQPLDSAFGAVFGPHQPLPSANLDPITPPSNQTSLRAPPSLPPAV